MNLIKVKGIVIKEVQYKDNDKIITILTDTLGKVSCIAKGAKKTNSPILANAQYLVYNEFVLYKSRNFYYINSANVIDTFYNIRIDLVGNNFLCNNCINNKDKRRYIKINKATLIAIEYIMKADIKKVFSFELKDISQIRLFADVYSDAMIGGI